MKALSIRQPWAWLIANGHKDIENRSWFTFYRGEFLIHASKKIDLIGCDDAFHILAASGQEHLFPHIDDFQCGGIIGQASIGDCVREHPSIWKQPDGFGFVITDAKPLEFMPCKGQLGFFDCEYCSNVSRQFVL